MHKGTHYDFSVYDNCYIITPKKHPALQTSRPQSGVFVLRTSFFVLRFISVAASSGHGYDLLLHLIDDHLDIGGGDLTVAVQVVRHVLRGLGLLHLVDDHLYVGGAIISMPLVGSAALMSLIIVGANSSVAGASGASNVPGVPSPSDCCAL